MATIIPLPLLLHYYYTTATHDGANLLMMATIEVNDATISNASLSINTVTTTNTTVTAIGTVLRCAITGF